MEPVGHPSTCPVATIPPGQAAVLMLAGRGHRACRAHLHCAVLLGRSGARSWGSCPRRVRSAEASQRWRPGPHARQRCAGAGNGRGVRAVARPHPGCAASRGAPGRKSRWRESLGPSAEASAAGAAGYRSRRSPGRRAAAQPALPALTPWRLEANFLCRLNVEPQGSSVFWGLEGGFLRPGYGECLSSDRGEMGDHMK